MLKHKIVVSKKSVEIPKADEFEKSGEMQIVVSWPEIGFISCECSIIDHRADVIQERSRKIEKILMKAMDKVADVLSGW